MKLQVRIIFCTGLTSDPYDNADLDLHLCYYLLPSHPKLVVLDQAKCGPTNAANVKERS